MNRDEMYAILQAAKLLNNLLEPMFASETFVQECPFTAGELTGKLTRGRARQYQGPFYMSEPYAPIKTPSTAGE